MIESELCSELTSLFRAQCRTVSGSGGAAIQVGSSRSVSGVENRAMAGAAAPAPPWSASVGNKRSASDDETMYVFKPGSSVRGAEMPPALRLRASRGNVSSVETRNTNGGNSSPRANGGSPRKRIGGSGGSGKLLVDAVSDVSPHVPWRTRLTSYQCATICRMSTTRPKPSPHPPAP